MKKLKAVLIVCAVAITFGVVSSSVRADENEENQGGRRGGGECRWTNGNEGFGVRGVHYVASTGKGRFRVLVSKNFYGNQGHVSNYACYRDAILRIEKNQYAEAVEEASEYDMDCVWRDGKSEGITQRGVHLLYFVPYVTDENFIQVPFSVGFFGNQGEASLRECKLSYLNDRDGHVRRHRKKN